MLSCLANFLKWCLLLAGVAGGWRWAVWLCKSPTPHQEETSKGSAISLIVFQFKTCFHSQNVCTNLVTDNWKIADCFCLWIPPCRSQLVWQDTSLKHSTSSWPFTCTELCRTIFRMCVCVCEIIFNRLKHQYLLWHKDFVVVVFLLLL